MRVEPALAPPRALGEPLGQGRVRLEPEDFHVEELLGFEPAGAGQHVLLKVRKREANTVWVARELAGLAGCRPFEVGYAGLKDRHAVAVQWFTVPRRGRAAHEWPGAGAEGFEVLEAHAHARKLPRGAHAGNRFRIRVRGLEPRAEALDARLRAIGACGVPNYFGPQRFGRHGSNLRDLPEDPGALRGEARGFVLSAARSVVFNAVLAERVRQGCWASLQPGDRAILDGRGSHFAVEALDELLRQRAERLEIHPTGPLWGRGPPGSSGAVLELERRVAGGYSRACALLEAAGMEPQRRSLRLAVRALRVHLEPGAVVLEFSLTRGAFATAVLREVCAFADQEESST
ncbi:MAG: tRNA pseudouridine(13) synthase TruD [Steroidobacteraceae bacterium]